MQLWPLPDKIMETAFLLGSISLMLRSTCELKLCIFLPLSPSPISLHTPYDVLKNSLFMSLSSYLSLSLLLPNSPSSQSLRYLLPCLSSLSLSPILPISLSSLILPQGRYCLSLSIICRLGYYERCLSFSFFSLSLSLSNPPSLSLSLFSLTHFSLSPY